MTLVAGFLGAGKTTLVRRLLEACPPEERYGVIVNEFGALGVDGELVVRGGSEESTLVELSNGCICCEIQEDLREALLSMTRAARRRGILGRRPRPLTRILIEASGAVSPITLTAARVNELSSLTTANSSPTLGLSFAIASALRPP